MESWLPEREQYDKRMLGVVVAQAVAVTIGFWVWLDVVHTVLGGQTPLILEEAPVVRDVLSQLLRGLFAVGITYVAVRRLGFSSPFEWVRLRRPVGWEWGYVPLGVVMMFVTLLGVNVLIQGVLGLERTVTGAALSERVLLSRVVTLLVLVGPAEELLFRGIIQRSLRDVLGPWPAIVVAGVLFGFGHVDPSATAPGDFLWLVGLSGLGVILGWLYERTENLAVPALAHGFFNSLTTAVPLLLG